MVTRQITADGIVAGDRLNLAGVDFTVTARRPMGMNGTTDHPSLLVTLVPGR